MNRYINILALTLLFSIVRAENTVVPASTDFATKDTTAPAPTAEDTTAKDTTTPVSTNSVTKPKEQVTRFGYWFPKTDKAIRSGAEATRTYVERVKTELADDVACPDSEEAALDMVRNRDFKGAWSDFKKWVNTFKEDADKKAAEAQKKDSESKATVFAGFLAGASTVFAAHPGVVVVATGSAATVAIAALYNYNKALRKIAQLKKELTEQGVSVA